MKASCQIKFQVSAYLRGTFLVQFFFSQTTQNRKNTYSCGVKKAALNMNSKHDCECINNSIFIISYYSIEAPMNKTGSQECENRHICTFRFAIHQTPTQRKNLER